MNSEILDCALTNVALIVPFEKLKFCVRLYRSVELSNLALIVLLHSKSLPFYKSPSTEMVGSLAQSMIDPCVKFETPWNGFLNLRKDP